MKKSLSLLISLLLVFISVFTGAQKSFANNQMLNINAPYAVLMDYETGEVLYDKNGHQKLYPASTTKAWTAYVVIKHVPDLSQKITIKDMPPIGGTSMYLKNGESFTVRQLLEGLMITSANDAAHVLANYVSGSIENFAKLMNDEARSIGAKNTNFNNPHGLPDKNHYTTAYDMAIMSRQAMSNEIFRNIVKMPYVKFPATEQYPEERFFSNSNEFLNSNNTINYKGKDIPIKYDIVDGIKTGFTDDAGLCLLSSAVKNDMRLISAVFKTVGTDRYLDSRTLLDYGFDNFYKSTIVNKEDHIYKKSVFLTKQGELIYEPKYSYKLILPNGTESKSYTTEVKLDDINLPIKKGDTVGTLDVYNGKELKHSIDLIAKDNVDSIFSFITNNKIVKAIMKIILFLFVLALLFIILVFIRKKYMRNKRRKKYIYTKRKSHKKIYSKKKSSFKYKR